MVGKNRVEANFSYNKSQYSYQKKRQTLFFTQRKAITLVDILKKKSQKTNISLGNFYTGDCSYKKGFKKY